MTTPNYYNSFDQGRVTLVDTGYTDITDGVSAGSLLTGLCITSLSGSNRIVTFADENDNVICAVHVPLNSGQTYTARAVDVLTARLLPGEYDSYLNRIYRLSSAKKIRAIVDNDSSDVYVHWNRFDLGATVPSYYGSHVNISPLTLTTSFQDLITGQTNSSVVTSIYIRNDHATEERFVTFADTNDKLIGVVYVEPNAGNVIASPPNDVLFNRMIAMTERDAYGNNIYRLKNANKLRVRVNSVTGGSCQVFSTRVDY